MDAWAINLSSAFTKFAQRHIGNRRDYTFDCQIIAWYRRNQIPVISADSVFVSKRPLDFFHNESNHNCIHLNVLADRMHYSIMCAIRQSKRFICEASFRILQQTGDAICESVVTKVGCMQHGLAVFNGKHDHDSEELVLLSEHEKSHLSV